MGIGKTVIKSNQSQNPPVIESDYPCTVHVLLSTELVMHVVPILVREIWQHGDSTHHNAYTFSLPKPR